MGFDDTHDFVDVLKDVVEHLDVGLRLGLARGTCAGVNDAIHVEVQVVEVWVVPRDLLLYLPLYQQLAVSLGEIVSVQVDLIRILLLCRVFPVFLVEVLEFILGQGIDYHLWVPFGKPSEKCWDSHYS